MALRSLGAIPIDYRAGWIDRLTRALEPASVDYAFDAVGGANISRCIGAFRRGGTLVGFGFMGASGRLSQLAMFANIFLGAHLRGRVGNFQRFDESWMRASYGLPLIGQFRL